MDDQVDEDVALHLLDVEQMVDQLDEGRKLEDLEDSLDLCALMSVQLVKFCLSSGEVMPGLVEDEETRRVLGVTLFTTRRYGSSCKA